jgi:hypothetical protein
VDEDQTAHEQTILFLFGITIFGSASVPLDERPSIHGDVASKNMQPMAPIIWTRYLISCWSGRAPG